MKTNNKGYSMVEMIIVIAIIAVLGGLGMLTMNIVYTAKANSVVNNVKSQLSSLKTMTEAKSADTAMALYYDKTEEMYVAEFGTYDLSASKFTGSDNKVKFSDRAVIYYMAEGATTERVVGEKGDSGYDFAKAVLIMFNKADGSVRHGAGTYRIAKCNKQNVTKAVTGSDTTIGDTVDTIKLNKNNGSLSR